MANAFKVVIPARYASTRLPGKPLRELLGKPMLQHVYEASCQCSAEQVVIATDDERIEAAGTGFGAEVCMTSTEHASGTDRLAEVVEKYGWSDDEIVVNVQGDEPLMPPALIEQVAGDLADNPEASISTIATPLVAAGFLLAKLTHAPNLVFASAIGQALCHDWVPLGVATIERLWIENGLVFLIGLTMKCK